MSYENYVKGGDVERLTLILAVVLISLATSPAHAWAPCGGQDDKLWSWAWVGEGGEHVELETISGLQRITFMRDLSGNGHHYRATFDASASSGWPFYEPNLSLNQEWGTYSHPIAPVMRDKMNDGTNVFMQWMDQDGSMNAVGSFYLAAAIMNTRNSGTRDLWGRDSNNLVVLRQGEDQVRIFVAGNRETITPTGAVPKGPVLLEIWRDASDVIHTRVNGLDVGLNPTRSGNFNVSGIGYKGDGSSGWDDYAFEFIACAGLPDSQDRSELREYLRSKWRLYGEVDETLSPPLPPLDVKVD